MNSTAPALRQLHCIGLSHQTAPIALRERLSFASETLAQTLAQRDDCQLPELLILSTCNRLELYATAAHYRILRDFLAESRAVCAQTLEQHLVHYQGIEAVNHLFRVAAGLESMVLGEPQILGQVTQAFETAVRQKSVGHQLTPLFRAAIRTGKRARTETSISRNSVSVSSAAVRMMASKLGGLHDKHILVVGAGQMAKLALKTLQSYRPQTITLVNRSAARGQPLAAAFGGDYLPFADLQRGLAAADLVVTATSAQQTIISSALVAEAMAQRSSRDLSFVDLAVPRDVDPDVGNLPRVSLYDVDDLQQQVDDALEQRRQAVPQVEAIIAAEMARFAQQMRKASVRPLITDLRQRAEEIRQQELARTLRHLPDDLDEATRQHIEHLSQSLVKKLLHAPTANLRQAADRGDAEEHVTSVRLLFGLEQTP